MTPERWQQINRLFHAALDRDAGARVRFVHDAAAGDAALEREVLSLLESHERSERYLESPAWSVAADLLTEGEPEQPLQEGQLLGKYRVVREVARGGMGVVYRATDEVLGRTVALKALPAEYAHDAARRERLAREARLAARLNHRAIATVYELIEAGDRLFIASEFVQGATLRRELEDGPLAPAHLVSTLIEIASALGAAHASGIIHRDLKPENIVRREDGQVKVLDFGLARTMAGGGPGGSALTEAGIIAGTPGYMAPETLNNAALDARSDIFVFGLVGWELATGRHPLGSNPHTQMARLHDITAGAEPSLTGPLSVPGLDRILRRASRRNPDERYASADQIVEDLRSLQRGAPVAPPSLDRLWWWQFHQAVMAVVIASTPIWSWLVRRAIERPLGTWLFFAILALATASVTLRLNLLFTSRVNPQMLPDHHDHAWRWLPRIEIAQSALLLWTATMVSDQHEATAALLISLAIVIVASLAMIEPATAKGAGIAE